MIRKSRAELDKNKRLRSVGTKVTESEWAILNEKANGLPLSEWVRSVVLSHAGSTPAELALMAELVMFRKAIFAMVSDVTKGPLTSESVTAAVKAAQVDRFASAQKAIGQAKQHLESQQGGTQA